MGIETEFYLGKYKFVFVAGYGEFIIAPDINHTETREAVIAKDESILDCLSFLYRDRARIYESLELEFAASTPISLNRVNFSALESSDRNPYLSDDAITIITQFLLDLDREKPPEVPIPKETCQGREGWVYVLEDKLNLGLYKIGMTQREPDTRVQEFSPKLPFPTKIIEKIKTDDVFQLELDLHEMFDNFRTNGEWFELTEEHIKIIKGLNGDNNGN